MDIAKIAIGVAPPHDINVIIEIPQGGEPIKYEVDKVSGALRVDRFLRFLRGGRSKRIFSGFDFRAIFRREDASTL